MIARLVIYVVLATAVFGVRIAYAETLDRVAVADPYIELRTGPGRGYPIFYVAEQGAHIFIVKKKTDWFKVRLSNDKQGWVSREQLEKTLSPEGEQIDFATPLLKDIAGSHWEAGLFGGDFGGASLISMYGAYAFTENLSFEVTTTQVLGDESKLQLYNLGIVHYVFPQWRATPYFSIGTGRIKIEPKSSLVDTENRKDDTVNVGLGLRVYLTRRFFFRMEYRNYIVLTDRDDNQELEEWKAGFSLFL